MSSGMNIRVIDMDFIDRFRKGQRKDSVGVDDDSVHNDITGDSSGKDNIGGGRITDIPDADEDMRMWDFVAKLKENSFAKQPEVPEPSKSSGPSEQSEMPKSSLSGNTGINTNTDTDTPPQDETQEYTPDEKIPKPGSSPVDRIPDESSVQKHPENFRMDNEIAASNSDSEEASGGNVQKTESTTTYATGILTSPVIETETTTEPETTTETTTEPETTTETADTPGEPKKRKGLFSGLFSKKEIMPEVYDPETHGVLVTPQLPEGYSVVEEYWIEKGLSKVLIVDNLKKKQKEYLLYEPVLTEFEYELLERLYDDLRDVLILSDEELGKNKEYVLFEKIIALLAEYGITLEGSKKYKIHYYIRRNFLGWSRLNPLMNDPDIEDISCDGSGIPIFLYHRKYHNIKTNLSFKEVDLNSLAITLAQRSGKHISLSSPMLDATLPNGSRLQLTLGTAVTTRGTSFTIRKFREDPFTPVELIEYGTFDADMLVYFWLAIENNNSLLFVGGTASGKTTSLNAVSQFIPPLSKVVSIEDTREVTLFHENWIATVTRDSVIESTGASIDMFDLLKAAMRQRPEYILVGEVRGSEAQTLFQAINTGHTTFSTIHANNADAAIHRLENAPLNVPRNMVQALDILSIQALVYRGHERVRRATEIVEITGVDPATGNLRVNTVFNYDPVSDTFSYTGRSKVYSAIMEQHGWNREEMDKEISNRREILNAMHTQDIRDYITVSEIFQLYFIDPAYVLENLDDLKKVFK